LESPDLTNLPSLSPIATKAQSAVVNLVVTRIVEKNETQKPPEPVSPFGPEYELNPPPGTKLVLQGSGFIYDPAGYVISNNHLVEGAIDIKVNFDDGREKKAEIVGRDPKTDLALLKLSDPGSYPYMSLGDSDQIKIGDWLVAIGNPFGLEHTVTVGILSARGRAIGAGPYDDFLQTDASINPGSSGGPLLSLKGEVVGVNAKIVSRGTGISFAIPSKLVAKIVDQLKTKGYVERGWLGVYIQAITLDMAQTFGLDKAEGALLADVFPDSPAFRAGLKHGDVVLTFDGRSVKEFGDLSAFVADSPPGQEVKVAILRDKKQMDLTVTVARMEDDPSLVLAAGGSLDLGLTLKPLAQATAKELGVTAGLLVENVANDSKAKAAGLATRDIILEVDRKEVASIEEYLKALRGHDKKTPALFWVRRGERTVFIAVNLK
jgi:serine protease Do